MKRFLARLSFFFFCFSGSFLWAQTAIPSDLNSLMTPGNFSNSINLMVSLSMITLVPFFLMSTTSFLRTVIVLSMIRQAIGTAQAPPNAVIVSLSLFLTMFVMTPTLNEVNQTAYQPFKAGKISQKEALEIGVKPFRKFMFKCVREKDLALFLEFGQVKYTGNRDAIPIFVLIPAFVISELKTAFQIGFLLFIPFVVVDLVVSNILLSLGMFMLSPAMVSLPFKILLFVLTDGWNLIIQGLLLSYR